MCEEKQYPPQKIPCGIASGISAPRPVEKKPEIDFNENFAEMEVAENPNSAQQGVPLPQRIPPAKEQPHRETFRAMREIARWNHSAYFVRSKFYDKQVRYENAKVFYKQALFMQDFEDYFDETAPFSAYFSDYQKMNYEQLRTYFTWRTKVRHGQIDPVPVSYAFVYIYELINLVGLDSVQDGLDQLMAFWAVFRNFDQTIDKYLVRWIKDYHIYYDLEHSFGAFVLEQKMEQAYPNLAADEDICFSFDRFCDTAKYDVRKSIFYRDHAKLIRECFAFVLPRLQKIFDRAGFHFEQCLYRASKSKTIWQPFDGALFYPRLRLPDKQVVLSKNEIYTRLQNKWTVSTLVIHDSAKQWLGYILKQMEAVLRKVTHFRYKLSVNNVGIDEEIFAKLQTAGVDPAKSIEQLVLAFYREKNKIVVRVDENHLSRIREDALGTQQKLIVPEEEQTAVFQSEPFSEIAGVSEQPFTQPQKSPAISDGWEALRQTLDDTERKALELALQGDLDFNRFAGENGVMPEVLADSINEKAMDCIGDNVLELLDELVIYEEYKEDLIKMVKA